MLIAEAAGIKSARRKIQVRIIPITEIRFSKTRSGVFVVNPL